MNLKKIIKYTLLVLSVCLAAGIGLFAYNADSSYKISSDFTSLPLQFDPDAASSTYQLQNAQITAYGAYIKGIQNENDNTQSVLIRALSPLPSVVVKADNPDTISLRIENINPDFYAQHVSSSDLAIAKETVNTLKFNVSVNAGQTVRIEPAQPQIPDLSGNDKYIIMGDNRDGYDTFAQIIQQVNAENPKFVIVNGDLVFSGKPNQYRLFDKLVSGVSSTLCTTLGNHDIRGDNGRGIYAMLYGPAYYSFDFGGSHFVFLDSSPGWTENQAVSEEQYAWLERDLKKAQGKPIFVISHIPPRDLRSNVTPNEIPNYINQVEDGASWVNSILNNYDLNKNMNHGFQDPQEAARFEKLMSTYHVDTVYLSHIHSYLEYTKDGVRYLISGGAGAELLSPASYYHYLIAKIGDIKTVTVVELASPANNYLARYQAAAQLFATAMYEENPLAVILVITGLVLLALLIGIEIYLWKKKPLDAFGRWLLDVGKYGVKHFREVFGQQSGD